MGCTNTNDQPMPSGTYFYHRSTFWTNKMQQLVQIVKTKFIVCNSLRSFVFSGIFIWCTSIHGQNINTFNYQAVAHDPITNQILANQDLNVKFYIGINNQDPENDYIYRRARPNHQWIWAVLHQNWEWRPWYL